jgi:hypothetical protein
MKKSLRLIAWKIATREMKVFPTNTSKKKTGKRFVKTANTMNIDTACQWRYFYTRKEQNDEILPV